MRLDLNIYVAYFDACLASNLREQYAALLSADEIAQWNRFATPILRDRYLVSHALVRCALSRHSQTQPHAWRFSTSANGKPFISAPHGDVGNLRFNLSHNDSVAVIAICHLREVGIDVESRNQDTELLDSSLVLSDTERLALQSISTSARSQCFFEHWTLKEAYLKATGIGFSVPLPSVELDLSIPGKINVSFAPALADVPENWAYFLYQIEPDMVMSLCVERERESDQLNIQLSQIIPLDAVTPMSNRVCRQG